MPRSPTVSRVTAIGRRSLGVSHPKVKEVLHKDFADCSVLAEALSDQAVPRSKPMILVNAVNNALLENDVATAEMLATEYWRPTREWKFWEYTTPEIRVVEEVEWPDSMAQSLALMAYQGDNGRLKQMLGRR